ncbi:MAG: MotA/TolQ/ExbB proton channel family protein [Planctomycetaceae bacterium]
MSFRMATEQNSSTKSDILTSSTGGDGSLGITLGLVFTSVFYAAIWMFPHPWMHRYFLGHWVCIVATTLFGVAASILLVKSLRISSESRLAKVLRDAELSPVVSTKRSAADQWVHKHDAGRVAAAWLQTLPELPASVRRSRLVGRLYELLGRQSGRVSTRHLSDDLREISARELDAAHDSLQLVRIIVWAIPMLGFLGTVIGITQTLGGLDFSSGDGAVDRLKSGLYVAFDTTAIGLVLSVVAIFLQFPVERAEQQLLAEIDQRISRLLFANLPADDIADNPAGQIAQLCDGIRVAVAESLASQTELWRQTIDEAHLHWQHIAQDNGQRIGDAIMQSLAPALRDHAQVVALQTQVVTDQTQMIREHVRALDEQSEQQRHQSQTLRDHAQAYAESQQAATANIDARWNHWTAVLSEHTRELAEQQQALVLQLKHLVEHQERTDELLTLQSALDHNLLRIAEASKAAQYSLETTAAGGISKAMVTLAAAVEILATRLSEESELPAVSGNLETRVRRAA